MQTLVKEKDLYNNLKVFFDNLKYSKHTSIFNNARIYLRNELKKYIFVFNTKKITIEYFGDCLELAKNELEKY